MPTSSREPDLPTFSQAPDKRMPSTIGSAIQDYRDSKPLPLYGATGVSLIVKGMTDGALNFGNFVRNSFANKSDYSGLGPRMTKWDGNTMSATESQDAKFNALLFADGLATGELKIRDGMIGGLNNLSGHYMQGSDISAKYLNIFKRNGVDVSKTHVKIYNSQGQVIKHISPK